MELIESQSDNRLISLNNNISDEFAKNFKRYYNSIKYNKYENEISKKKDNINKYFCKKESKNINPNSNPVEFYYEFKDYIKGGIEKNNSKDKDKEKETEKIKKISQTERKGEKNKNISKKTIKNIQNKKDEIFWEKVKLYIDLKNEHLNELTYKIKMEKFEKLEENKSEKNLNKSSFLFYPKKTKLLYHNNNINENSLSKNFENFYKLYQKEQNITNNKLYKKNFFINDSCNSIFNEYQKFYENKLNWIKKRDNKINLERNKLELQDNIIINSFSFRPHIDKNSIQLIKKRNDFINFMENKPNTERNYHNIMINKKEIYQKYLATIRPYMSLYYEKHSPFYKKNNLSFNKRKSSVDIGMIHINKGKNIKIIKDKNNDNNLHDISQENNNKTVINKSNNIFNIFKPEKKEKYKHIKKNRENENKSNKNIIINQKSKIRQKMWRKEFNGNNINKYKNDEKKYDFNDLYKMNVRDNSSWNKICINKIVSKPRDKNVINDFL